MSKESSTAQSGELNREINTAIAYAVSRLDNYMTEKKLSEEELSPRDIKIFQGLLGSCAAYVNERLARSITSEEMQEMLEKIFKGTIITGNSIIEAKTGSPESCYKGLEAIFGNERSGKFKVWVQQIPGEGFALYFKEHSVENRISYLDV